MRKQVLGGVLILTMAVAMAGCSSSSNSDSTTEAEGTTAKEKKVLEKFEGKTPKITSSKKTDQLADAQKGETIAQMKVKGYGTMTFKFFNKETPLAVKNFLTLASSGYYDGLKFHRVRNDFMIQSGDPEGTGTGGQSIWGEEFANENSDKLLPLRGALCMANAGEDTNGSQFFIVQAKASVAQEAISQGQVQLTDAQQKLFEEQGGYPSLIGGYTVFGQMINGYDVLDEIAAVDVKDSGSGEKSTPTKDVIIEKITVSTAK